MMDLVNGNNSAVDEMVTTLEFLSETDDVITFKVDHKLYSEVLLMNHRPMIRTENYLTFLEDDSDFNINDVPESCTIEGGGELVYYVCDDPDDMLYLEEESDEFEEEDDSYLDYQYDEVD